MSHELYDRCWQLSLVPRGTSKAIVYGSEPKLGYPLRMAFEIDRTLHSHSNKAKITITNASQQHRVAIDRGTFVILDCGYGPNLKDYASRVYVGQVMEKEQAQDGPDIHLELKCGDFELPLQASHVHLSYRSKVSLAKLVQDVCNQLHLELNGQVYKLAKKTIQRLPPVSFDRYVVSGQAKQILDDLLTPRNIQWSIQNGSLLIQGKQGITRLQSTLLTPYTGLLERPTLSKKGISVKALLQASIEPGMAITIKSASSECNGNFRVCEAKYRGDTHGGDWTVEAYCEQLLLPLASYTAPTNQKGNFEGAQSTDSQESLMEQEALAEGD